MPHQYSGRQGELLNTRVTKIGQIVVGKVVFLTIKPVWSRWKFKRCPLECEQVILVQTVQLEDVGRGTGPSAAVTVLVKDRDEEYRQTVQIEQEALAAVLTSTHTQLILKDYPPPPPAPASAAWMSRGSLSNRVLKSKMLPFVKMNNESTFTYGEDLNLNLHLLLKT